MVKKNIKAERFAELEFKEALYEKICADISQLVFILNKKRKIIFFGGASEKVIGYSSEEIKSNFSKIQKLVHKEDKDLFLKNTDKLLSGSINKFNISIRIINKEGNEKFIDLNAKTVGRLYPEKAFLFYGLDITDIFNSKNEIQKAKIELQRKNNEIEIQNNEFYSQNEKIQIINEELRGINNEFKKVNKEIARNEKKYKLLFGKMNDGFALCEVIFDKKKKPIDYMHLEVNSMYEELRGFKNGTCLKKTIKQLYLKEDNELIKRLCNVAITKEADSFKQLCKKTKKYFHYTVYSPVSGQFAIILRDVTEIEKTLSALEDSEERFRVIFNDAPDTFYIIDSKGNFLNGNKAAEKLIGAKREDFIGKNYTKVNILPPKYLPKAITSFGQNMLGFPTGPDEYKLVRKDGNTVEVEISTYPVRIDGKLCLLGIARDITKRKIIENALREKSMLNEVFAEISQEILKSDYSVNKLAELISLYAKKITNSKVGFVSALKKDDNKVYNLSLLCKAPKLWSLDNTVDDISITKKNKAATDFIISLIMKSDGFFINKPKEYPIFESIPNKPLSVRRFLTVPVVIDGRTEGQIILTNSNKDYNTNDLNSVKQMADIFALALQRTKFETDLIDARKRAEESDRLKSLFVANMSHEIRTPMNGVLGFSQLLKRPNLSDEKRDKYSTIIDSSGKALLKIINDIIDISKIESGQLTMEIEDCSVNEILTDLYDFFNELRILKKKTNIDIVINIDEKNDVKIATDPYRLRQVFINLFQNAIKNTKKGSVEYGYRKGDKGYINFYVKDTGVGISKEQKDKVFGRFVQVKSSQYQEGTGLGLSISDNIVKLLGGKIWLKSELGKGSEFCFTHPLSLSGIENINLSNNSIEINNWKDKIILVAEDNDVNYDYIFETLEVTGVKLIRAKNGLEAVNLFKDKKPDLILMDIKMPVLDGFAATRKIREINEDIPIIAQTAYAMKEDKNLYLSAGCNDYITKPINSEKIFNVIGRFMK